jgi:flavin-dependent dehydrogenase
VIGGGPAGASAAILLARAGITPLVIERDAEPGDALCGGFLSWKTLERLARLDVDPFALNAHPVTRLALFSGTQRAEAPLPAPAAGLSRRALDTALLARAVASGAHVERRAVARSFDGARLRLADGGMIDAAHVILATGKHDLRGWQRPRPSGDPMLGLRWRLRTGPALERMLDGRIELHLFDGGYAGLVRHEQGANLCLALRRSRFAAAASRPVRLLVQLAQECPALAARLDAAYALEAPQALANIPYGWRADGETDLYRIGDQGAVVPSFAGEGISIALASGAAAAEAVRSGVPAHAYQRAMRQRLAMPFRIAGGLARLAERSLGATALVEAVRLAPALATRLGRWTRLAYD